MAHYSKNCVLGAFYKLHGVLINCGKYFFFFSEPNVFAHAMIHSHDIEEPIAQIRHNVMRKGKKIFWDSVDPSGCDKYSFIVYTWNTILTKKFSSSCHRFNIVDCYHLCCIYCIGMWYYSRAFAQQSRH